MPQDFDIQAARAAGYTDGEIADYLRSTGRDPRQLFTQLDARPTSARPLVHQDDPATLDQALGKVAETGIQVGLPLGLGALGGPAAMTAGRMAIPAFQAAFGPFTHAQPGVLQGAVPDPKNAELTAARVLAEAARTDAQKLSYAKWSAANPDAEKGMFDFAGATPALEGRPMLPRYTPPRGIPERLADALSNSAVTRGMRKAVEKGKSMMPESWYRTGPLYDVFMEELGPDTAPTAYKRFMELVSATSPQSRVPDNVRIASYYNYLDRNGLELPETPAPGYGAKAQILHRQNVVDMQNGGLDPLKNPKPSSFVENLLGNETPVTVDTHNFRLLGILSKDPRFLATKTDTGFNPRQAFADGKITIEQALQNPTWWDSAPLKTEYAAYEAYQQKLANKLGMTPAEFQEKMWVGAGDKTGLGSPPETWLRTFARRVQYTAARLNADPDVVMRKFIRGEIPLLGVGGAAALGGLSDGAPDTNEPHR